MNTNDHCWVQLNDHGWRVHDQFYERLRLDPAPYRKNLEDDSEYQAEHHGQTPGFMRFQLHELMHIFGPAMYNGAFSVPFERNEVYFERPTELTNPGPVEILDA